MKKVLTIVLMAAAVVVMGLAPQTALADGSISGTVSDANGDPVAGARVMIQGMDMRRGHRPFMGRAETDEGGAYVFADVPDGRYILGAMARQLGGARSEGVVENGADIVVDFQLQGRNGGGNGGGEERPMGSLNGSVVDADNQPVANAHVVIVPARLIARGQRVRPIYLDADENGLFDVDSLPAGVWVVTAGVRGVGMGRARVQVEPDAAADVTITIRGHR